MSKIKIYKDNPTAGGTNGTLVSSGTGLAPISTGVLRADLNEVSANIKLAVRCDSGYETSGNTTISLTGTTASKWSLAPDSSGSPGTWGAYGGSLTITSKVDSTNTIFWARAKATSDELPVNDTTVQLKAEAVISAV
jgi:hypothetical protein